MQHGKRARPYEEPVQLGKPYGVLICRVDLEACAGLSFFYAPQIAEVHHHVLCREAVLSLRDAGDTPCQEVAARCSCAPCPTHGPFPCPCAAMHLASQRARDLCRELGISTLGEGVVVCEWMADAPLAPCCVRVGDRQWSVELQGLPPPLPGRVLGPFPLGAVSPASILADWDSYERLQQEAFQRAGRACCTPRCATAACAICSRCRYPLCAACAFRCEACGDTICSVCCARNDEPPCILCLICNSCS